MAEENFAESLLQEKRDEEEGIEADNGIGSCGGDGAVTLALLFTTFTALCSTFSYGTAKGMTLFMKGGYTSPVQTDIMSGLNLSLAEFSFFGSVLTLGGLIGASLSGKLADRFGRRGGLWISNSFCFAGWVTIAFSKAAWSLDLGRLLTGIAAGIVSYLVPVYIVEIAPTSMRGTFSAVNTLVLASGINVTYLAGSVVSWKCLALISTIPCLVGFLSLIFALESPRWLSLVGRIGESKTVLQRLRGKNTNISKEAVEIKNYMKNVQEIKEDGFLELFNPRYSRVIIVGIGLLALQQLGGLSAYSFYMSYIFEKSGFPSKTGVIASSFVQSIMSIVGLLLIDKCGRRPLIMVASVLMCMASTFTGLSFLFQGYNLFSDFSPILALMGVLVFLTSVAIGIGGIPWIMISEMTPINMKASAGTVCNVISWSSTWFVSYTFNFLFQWSPSGVFFIYAIISGLGILFVAKMVPETRGRSLEEIQDSITR